MLQSKFLYKLAFAIFFLFELNFGGMLLFSNQVTNKFNWLIAIDCCGCKNEYLPIPLIKWILVGKPLKFVVTIQMS